MIKMQYLKKKRERRSAYFKQKEKCRAKQYYFILKFLYTLGLNLKVLRSSSVARLTGLLEKT